MVDRSIRLRIMGRLQRYCLCCIVLLREHMNAASRGCHARLETYIFYELFSASEIARSFFFVVSCALFVVRCAEWKRPPAHYKRGGQV